MTNLFTRFRRIVMGDQAQIELGIQPTGTLNIMNNGEHDVTEYATANVSVPASAVVSGTKPITENGTGIDVTNYASVDVNVATGAQWNKTINFVNSTQSSVWLRHESIESDALIAKLVAANETYSFSVPKVDKSSYTAASCIFYVQAPTLEDAVTFSITPSTYATYFLKGKMYNNSNNSFIGYAFAIYGFTGNSNYVSATITMSGSSSVE